MAWRTARACSKWVTLWPRCTLARTSQGAGSGLPAVADQDELDECLVAVGVVNQVQFPMLHDFPGLPDQHGKTLNQQALRIGDGVKVMHDIFVGAGEGDDAAVGEGAVPGNPAGVAAAGEHRLPLAAVVFPDVQTVGQSQGAVGLEPVVGKGMQENLLVARSRGSRPRLLAGR